MLLTIFPANEARKSPSKLRWKFATNFAENFANFTLEVADPYVSDTFYFFRSGEGKGSPGRQGGRGGEGSVSLLKIPGGGGATGVVLADVPLYRTLDSGNRALEREAFSREASKTLFLKAFWSHESGLD